MVMQIKVSPTVGFLYEPAFPKNAGGIKGMGTLGID